MLHLKYKRTEQQYQFCLEANTIYLGELQAVSPHTVYDMPVAKLDIWEPLNHRIWMILIRMYQYQSKLPGDLLNRIRIAYLI